MSHDYVPLNGLVNGIVNGIDRHDDLMISSSPMPWNSSGPQHSSSPAPNHSTPGSSPPNQPNGQGLLRTRESYIAAPQINNLGSQPGFVRSQLHSPSERLGEPENRTGYPNDEMDMDNDNWGRRQGAESRVTHVMRFRDEDQEHHAAMFLQKNADNLRCEVRFPEAERELAPHEKEDICNLLLNPASVNMEQLKQELMNEEDLERLWVYLRDMLHAIGQIWLYRSRLLDGQNAEIPFQLQAPLLLFLNVSPYPTLLKLLESHWRHNNRYEELSVPDEGILSGHQFLDAGSAIPL